MAIPDERLDEEETLVARAQSGDAAFEQLFRRHHMSVHAFAYLVGELFVWKSGDHRSIAGCQIQAEPASIS